MNATAELTAAIQAPKSASNMRQLVQHQRNLHRAAVLDRDELLLYYQGGLPAEQQSAAAAIQASKNRCQSIRCEVRRAVLDFRCQRIDLTGIMSLRRADGRPLWAIVDPRRPIDRYNGYHDTDDTIYWPCRSSGSPWTAFGKRNPNVQAFSPAGMPPLPAAVRALVASPKITRRANRIGVLYMPDAWTEVSTDPALVVEWKDLPGQYYVLAVWGADAPIIREWTY